jgi:hypothetical protein
MLKPEEIIKRLEPLPGYRKKADEIWETFLCSDEEERKTIRQSLEILHSQEIEDFKQDKIVLPPPYRFDQLYGDYPVGMVHYADNPLYPFAFLDRELQQHLGVFGRTGAGKSYLIRKILLTHLGFGKPFMVFDWKSTFSDLVNCPGTEVLLFSPGSTSLPFSFNPLDTTGIPTENSKAYLRQVVELLIESYLGNLQLLTVHGVEYLLLSAIDDLQEKNQALSFQAVYDWIKSFEGKMREMDWKTTALDILYKLVTGPIGIVMQGKSRDIAWLAKQKIIFELQNSGNSKDKSFFIKTLLLRLYYYFMSKGSSSHLKLFIVLEEAHNVLQKRGAGAETIVELMLRQSREFGIGICVIDQHPSLMSLPGLGTFCTVCFNLRTKQDQDAMASSLLLEEKDYLGRLPPRFAIVKVQGRFLTPFLIKTFDVPTYKKLPIPKTRDRMKKQMVPKKDGCSGNPVPSQKEGRSQEISFKKAPNSGYQTISREIRPCQNESKVVRAVRKTAKGKKSPLTWDEIFLIHIYLYPLMPTVRRYDDLKLNKHQGHKYRTSLLTNGFIFLESIPTSSGRIKLMILTEKGAEWLMKRGFYSSKSSDKEGGILHQYWKGRLQEQFSEQGFSAQTEVSIGKNQTADLVVSGTDRRVSIEIETGKNGYAQIMGNISKGYACFDGVVSFVLDSKKAERIRERIGVKQNTVVVTDEIGCFESVIQMLAGDAM